jgi:quercetin dioxygenase-like cupin family protein
LCAFEQRSEPGTGAAPHRHPDHEELVIVLEGAADFTVGGIAHRVSNGGAVIVPAGAVHSFSNPSRRLLRTLAIFGNASPTVVYENEPSVTLAIGSTGCGAHRNRTA